jgi:hypothetical protein
VSVKNKKNSDVDLGWDQEYHAWRARVLRYEEVERRVGNLGIDDKESILIVLHQYCRPYPPEVLSVVREQARVRRSAGQKLDTAVQALEKVFKQIGDDPECQHLIDVSANLRSELQRYRSFLESWERDYAAASSEKGKARNDRVLFELAIEVFEATGEPHWSDLAYLVERGLLACGIDEDVTPASISQRVSRFVKSYPSLDHPFQQLLQEPIRGHVLD